MIFDYMFDLVEDVGEYCYLFGGYVEDFGYVEVDDVGG